MKATIDIPDDLYRRVKARTAEEGRRIREVAADLFQKWLDEGGNSRATAEIPVITPAQLTRHRDAESLRAAYPQGYRLSGPLIPARKGAPQIPAAVVEQALENMDQEELDAHAHAR
jgi:hypothetical protein